MGLLRIEAILSVAVRPPVYPVPSIYLKTQSRGQFLI